ncbi:MAG: ATP-binding cassette domain-containing protein [Alphaproteobacteria bacterium]|nr:ATP-binding cassette domain-containing protein [Alphaproteobacteria bacterium]
MQQTQQVVARLSGVTRRFREVVAVEALELELRPGEVLGLLGPNGSGKSTTLRMLLGLLAPSEGTVSLFGGPPNLQARRRVGYLPEQRGLYEEMKAIDQLVWFARLHGVPEAEAADRARAFLERLGLGDRVDGKLSEYSKGMQQRVQLGAALIHQPELVILDEPFSGLDPVSQDVFAEVVLDEAARGAAVLLSTHDLHHAEQVCDRVVVMIKGHKEIDERLATLRRQAGEGRVRLRVDPDSAWLRVPEVVDVRRVDKGVEVRLAEGVAPRWVLDRALEAGVLPERFEVAEPSLHEIVVRRIRGSWDDAGEPT